MRWTPWKTTAITAGSEIVGDGPDIGAYEYGAREYWIGGFKGLHAPTPAPRDGTMTASDDCDLMWLGVYRADAHDVYFSVSADEIKRAKKGNSAFRKTFVGSANIFHPGELERGRTYYWRVDGRQGDEIVEGMIWRFAVGK